MCSSSGDLDIRKEIGLTGSCGQPPKRILILLLFLLFVAELASDVMAAGNKQKTD